MFELTLLPVGALCQPHSLVKSNDHPLSSEKLQQTHSKLPHVRFVLTESDKILPFVLQKNTGVE